MQQQKSAVLNNTRNSLAESSFRESSILILMKDYGRITFTAVIAIVTINFFFTSTGLAPGDVTNPSLVCSIVLGIPVSVMSLCISIPLLILPTIALGKSFGIKTLYVTLAAPLFMKLVPPIHTIQFLLDIHPLLESVVVGPLGGLLVGATVGIALNHACATGGTNVIVLLIQYVFKFPKVNVILLFLDGSVVIASGVTTQNALVPVFSFLPLIVTTQTISFVTKYKLSTWATAS